MGLLADFIRTGYARARARIGRVTPAAPAPAAPEEQNSDSARFEQARVFHQQGQLKEAEDIYQALLQKYPKDFDLLLQMGMAHGQRNQFVPAIAFIEQAIAADPNNAAAHGSLGNCLKGLGKHEEALASYDRALALRPNDADTLSNRGTTLRDLQRPEEALDSYDRALALNPDHVLALDNRGTTLRELKRLDEALTSHDKALVINPGYASAHYNRGLVLADLKRTEDARASYQRALELNPNYCEALNNLGVVLFELKRFEEALASYNHAIRIRSDHVDTHTNLSVCLLYLGDFARGWEEYEWRWQTARHRDFRMNLRAPAWEGRKVHGSLLVWNEQGLGDEIFYAGMLKDLEPYAESVTVCVAPRLVRLFQRSFGSMHVISREMLTPDAHFDAHIPLGSLGRYLRPSFSAFPKVAKPYLCASPTQMRSLRANLTRNKRLICGLSWVSKNPAIGMDKSLRLQDLEPMLRLSGIDFVDLQYGNTDQEQSALHAATGLTLQRITEIDNFNDIDGLAALIDACDIVVTVSNTTAHLAAALGKPVLLMLPFSQGLLWYWHSERTDSPWYPTAHLYRQPAIGDWGSVIAMVSEELARYRTDHSAITITEAHGDA